MIRVENLIYRYDVGAPDCLRGSVSRSPKASTRR